MGGLHSWCLAAERPELVSALVVEDMAPDFRGRTTGPWEPWVHALPVEFPTEQAVFDEFGPVAGQYFLEAFDRTATGWRLHGDPQRWIEIAAEWGTRDYWEQWRAVRAPALLIEAGNSVTPPGQMLRDERNRSAGTYLHVPGAGHLVHDDAPEIYRDAVEAFLVRRRRVSPSVVRPCTRIGPGRRVLEAGTDRVDVVADAAQVGVVGRHR